MIVADSSFAHFLRHIIGNWKLTNIGVHQSATSASKNIVLNVG